MGLRSRNRSIVATTDSRRQGVSQENPSKDWGCKLPCFQGLLARTPWGEPVHRLDTGLEYLALFLAERRRRNGLHRHILSVRLLVVPNRVVYERLLGREEFAEHVLVRDDDRLHESVRVGDELPGGMDELLRLILEDFRCPVVFEILSEEALDPVGIRFRIGEGTPDVSGHGFPNRGRPLLGCLGERGHECRVPSVAQRQTDGLFQFDRGQQPPVLIYRRASTDLVAVDRVGPQENRLKHGLRGTGPITSSFRPLQIELDVPVNFLSGRGTCHRKQGVRIKLVG